ncbi:MAG: isoprenylcysteine carboxylmethyltransferase family protein [Ignavibacteria bacterium]|nr:isoprenylcysteine carboxylmethyltransferase family protein [Ignavibacteria bacterium]
MKLSYTLVAVQFICIIYLMLTGEIIPVNKLYLTLLILSLIPGIWAIYTFRFRFNIFPHIKEGQDLNTSGPYKFVRHPMYTSVITLTLIWVVNKYTIIRFIVWSALVIVLIIKLKYEERLLSEKFPEYISYTENSKMIIPFLY